MVDPRRPRPLLVATGEVSGDRAAAALVAEVLERRPSTRVWGLGGSALAAAGADLIADTNSLGSVGVVEGLATVHELKRLQHLLEARLHEDPPAVALLVGNDLFNLALGRRLRQLGVAVVCLFPPQLWIWGALAWAFRSAYDLVLTSFPDEEARWRRAGAETLYIGHYLTEKLSAVGPRERLAHRHALGIREAGDVLALLLGSREAELDQVAPMLAAAARALTAERPDLVVLAPVADPTFRPRVTEVLAAFGVPARIVDSGVEALRCADFALMCSGTASLEAALLEVPSVLAYRVAPVTYAILRLAQAARLVPGTIMGLPNLVAGRSIVPELRQSACRVDRIVAATRPLLDPARRALATAGLAEVRQRLSLPGGLALGGEAVVELLDARHALEVAA